jgi:acetyl esterase
LNYARRQQYRRLSRAAVAAAASGACVLLGIAGDSAVGNLAAVTALRLRPSAGRPDRYHRATPNLAAQLLLYPILDATMSGAPYSELADGYYLTAALMRWYWDNYGSPAGSVGEVDAVAG